MTIQVNIDVDQQLITQNISGELLVDELLSAFKNMYQNPDFKSSMDILVIVQPGSTSSLSAGSANQLVDLMRRFANKRGQGKSAVIATDASDYGMSHVVQFLLKDEAREIRVFENMDDAKQWLGL